VVISKLLNCLQDRVFHIVLNDLLAFFLDQEVAVVLRHLRVVRG
jgi:hypothetical protein